MKYNKALHANSKNLRKNMTPEENHLWYDFLKALPVNVKRQAVIGCYIVDFYCPSCKIVIEIDGWQHYEVDGENKDKIRDDFLASLGIKVLRYSNRDVNCNFKNVCNDIYFNLNLNN